MNVPICYFFFISGIRPIVAAIYSASHHTLASLSVCHTTMRSDKLLDSKKDSVVYVFIV